MGEEAKKGKPSQLSQQGPENANVEAEHFSLQSLSTYVLNKMWEMYSLQVHCRLRISWANSESRFLLFLKLGRWGVKIARLTYPRTRLNILRFSSFFLFPFSPGENYNAKLPSCWAKKGFERRRNIHALVCEGGE